MLTASVVAGRAKERQTLLGTVSYAPFPSTLDLSLMLLMIRGQKRDLQCMQVVFAATKAAHREFDGAGLYHLGEEKVTRSVFGMFRYQLSRLKRVP